MWHEAIAQYLSGIDSVAVGVVLADANREGKRKRAEKVGKLI